MIWGTAATVVSIRDTTVVVTGQLRLSGYCAGVSLRCLLRAHRPMLTSIVRREGRYTALCDHCGLPIGRPEVGRWAASPPLTARQSQAVSSRSL